jgi:hypothetical protein
MASIILSRVLGFLWISLATGLVGILLMVQYLISYIYEQSLMHEFKTTRMYFMFKNSYFMYLTSRIVVWIVKELPLHCRKSWRSDTQPYNFLKPYYISIVHIYPSFPVWCICVLTLIHVVFKQFSFMAMRKMWIVVCPSKLIKIHWEKDTGQNDVC